MTQVTLKSGKSRPVVSGHPWVFSGAIAKVDKPGDDFVEVLDDEGRSLGFGLLSEHSDIRIRMAPSLCAPLGVPEFAASITAALNRRLTLGLGGDDHNAFRLVNSEGDGLPGLIVDHLGNVLTVQITTAPMFRRLNTIVEALRLVFPDHHVLRIPPPEFVATKERFSIEFGWEGTPGPDEVTVREGDVVFVIPTDRMQKTGHYADMRIHREWVSRISRGKRVLDAYSYSGGFGLHAAAGGASEVVCVDSSADACDAVRRNAEINGFGVHTQQSKVDDFLRSSFDRGSRFDIVILDPPKLAPSKKHATGALRLYESLAIQAVRIIEDGILCVGSCSEAIGLYELERVMSNVQARTDRRMSTIYVGTQSPDHPYPTSMPEGRYLTFLAVQVSPA
jgi:23S rRNA (cytosine1962-C5)-methyltransferase